MAYLLRALAPAVLLLSAALPSLAQEPIAAIERPGHSVLAARIDQIVDDVRFENAFWGIRIVDVQTGEQLYGRNDRRSFVPASNAKLYTTAAALDALGPDYRYHTLLFADGLIESGVLRGNLIVRGAGDPTIGGHYDLSTGTWSPRGDATRLFLDWADSLRAAGITRVEGDVVGDAGVMDDVPLGRGWAWDDETFYYSAQLSGLSFKDNVIHLHVQARERGAPARLRWEPYDTDYVQVVNRTRTVSQDSVLVREYRRVRGTNLIEVSTLIPEGTRDVVEITVENPALYFVHVLRETLLRAGIAVTGDAVALHRPPVSLDYASTELQRLAIHPSPPLAEIASAINKPSQNLYADMVLKTIATEFPAPKPDLEPGSAPAGIEIAMATFVRAGIDTSRIRLVDGSGLSRMNLVTPEMTTDLLGFMWNHPDPRVRDAFVASLPVAGADGTLRNRLRSGPAGGNLRAKTGTLTGVSALSGYVRTPSNRMLAFSIMTNHFTTGAADVRRAQDRLVDLLARYEQ